VEKRIERAGRQRFFNISRHYPEFLLLDHRISSKIASQLLGLSAVMVAG